MSEKVRVVVSYLDIWGSSDNWYVNDSTVVLEEIVSEEEVSTSRKLLKYLRNCGVLSKETAGDLKVEFLAGDPDTCYVFYKGASAPFLCVDIFFDDGDYYEDF